MGYATDEQRLLASSNFILLLRDYILDDIKQSVSLAKRINSS
jgi:hypothetical protein